MVAAKSTPITVMNFLKFLMDNEQSPATIKNYRGDLTQFAAWFMETNGDELNPTLVTPTDLREYKQSLVRQKLRPATINRKFATLRSYMNWAANSGHLTDGLMPTMPKPVRQVTPGPRWLDRREVNALLRATERGGNLRDVAIVVVLLHTGLRVQELCNLHWSDITIMPRKGKLVVRHGKGDRQRKVPLNADARNTLMTYGYGNNAGKDASVFLGQRGPLTVRGLQSMFDKYATRAEIEDASPHCLRHTFCKTLIDAGAHLHEVARLAGHQSLETTRRYCEPSIKDLERTVSLIEEAA